MFKNPTPGHEITIDERDHVVRCSCGVTHVCDDHREADHVAGQHFASTRFPKSGSPLPPLPPAPALQVPPGLDATEALNYRRGYSAAFGKYLKAHGTPSIQGIDRVKLRTHAAAWHREHNEPRASAAHRAGLSAVRAYWKRHGITDRGHLIGTVARIAKPKTTTCEHCGQLTAVA